MSNSTIEKLQLLQQNYQQFLAQKQQLQTQLLELDSAIEQLAKTTTSYKIIGKIMVLYPQDQLKTEMEHKKEMVQIRIEKVHVQETSLQKEIAIIQQELQQKE